MARITFHPAQVWDSCTALQAAFLCRKFSIWLQPSLLPEHSFCLGSHVHPCLSKMWKYMLFPGSALSPHCLYGFLKLPSILQNSSRHLHTHVRFTSESLHYLPHTVGSLSSANFQPEGNMPVCPLYRNSWAQDQFCYLLVSPTWVTLALPCHSPLQGCIYFYLILRAGRRGWKTSMRDYGQWGFILAEWAVNASCQLRNVRV